MRKSAAVGLARNARSVEPKRRKTQSSITSFMEGPQPAISRMVLAFNIHSTAVMGTR